MMKALNKLGIEGNYLTLIRNIYRSPTANTALDEKLIFPTKIRHKAGVSPLTTPFQYLLKVLISVMKKKRKIYRKVYRLRRKI